MEASEQVLDANARHMQTEKRRRDRIANGFETLRELLPYQDRRMDKATFLQEVVEYVRQLQGTVHDVLKHGGLSSLPEEVQWQIRLLLPRQAEDGQGPVRDVPVQEPEAAHLGPQDTNASLEPVPSQSGGADPRIPGGTARPQHHGLQAASGAEDAAIDNQARITQLQQMLRDLQSQQAASSQQLQIQQAALMQSQVFNALKLQHLVQQPNNLPLQQGSALELFQGLQTSHAMQPHQFPWHSQAPNLPGFPALRENPDEAMPDGKETGLSAEDQALQGPNLVVGGSEGASPNQGHEGGAEPPIGSSEGHPELGMAGQDKPSNIPST